MDPPLLAFIQIPLHLIITSVFCFENQIACTILPNMFLSRGGILTDKSCPATGETDHSIVLVGYGTNATTGMDYWIGRNSWGTKWGMQGYFVIKRGINLCGIERYAAKISVLAI